ncbi:MAG: single-stranded DNA-binding protein [Chloroflexota bacterium]
MNSITVKGRLAQQPELRHTAAGHAVVTLRIADNRRVKDREVGVFHDIELWREAAEEAGTHHKGDRVTVVGRLDYDQWTAADGSKRSRAKIVGLKVTFPEAEEPQAAAKGVE